MVEINTVLISKIQKIIDINLTISEINSKLAEYNNSLKNSNVNNFEKILNDVSSINDILNQLEEIINDIKEIEPNYEIRCLYFSLVNNLNKENYIKCNEISNLIKNFNK